MSPLHYPRSRDIPETATQGWEDPTVETSILSLLASKSSCRAFRTRIRLFHRGKADMAQKVQGKTAIVTGAGSGINLSFASLLLGKGCSVVFADIALRPEAQEVVSSQR